MAIVKYQDSIADSATGRPIANVNVQVFEYPSGDAATVYDSASVVSTAAIVTDRDGAYSFYAEDGHYNIVYYYGGITKTLVDVLVGGIPGAPGPSSSGYTLLSSYESLAAMVAAVGPIKQTVGIDADTTLSANITIPANIELLPLNGAVINHGAYTISYAGSTSRWPDSRVFSGTGGVSGMADPKPIWFGAAYDAVTDDSSAIRAAIACSLASGGGVVRLPTANIKMSNIVVRHGVKLIGNGDVATTIIVTDTVNPAVLLEDYCAVESMRFYYPDQVVTGTPTAYPPTITHSTTPSFVTIRDIKFQGAYDAVILGDASFGVGEVLIDHLTGFPLHIGIQFDNNTDTARINNVHFNPNVYGAYTTSLLAWVYQNGTALSLLRSDAPQVNSFFAFGYKYGITLNTGNPSGSANMVKVVNSGFDICQVPLNILHSQDGVQFTNCVFTSGATYAEVVGGANVIGGGSSATSGLITFNNCSFRHYHTYIATVATNTVFDTCTFDDYDIAAGNYAALSGGYDGLVLVVDNSSFDGRSRAGSRGIENLTLAADITVTNTKFNNIADRDILAVNTRLIMARNKYSAGSIWNGVSTIDAPCGSTTYQSPTEFGGAGPFIKGDAFSMDPSLTAVGSPKGWRCTVSGTPGTWVSEGNL